MLEFGRYIRKRRTELSRGDRRYSQRQVALRIGIEPSYLSKVERGHPAVLSEAKIIALAKELGEDPDFLLALGGKVSSDVLEVIRDRPRLFANIVRQMKDLPSDVIEAEEEYRQIQARLEKTHEMAGVGLYDFSLNGGRDFWTEQTPLILGLDAGTAAGLEALEGAVLPEDRIRFRWLKSQAEQSRTPFEMEVRANNPGMVARFVRIWGRHEYAPDGSATALLGVVQDTTARRLLEQELEEAKQALELELERESGRVVEAIHKLKAEIDVRRQVEKELKQARTEAFNIALTQKQFFRQSCHALRTSLDTIGKTATGCQEQVPGQMDKMNERVEGQTFRGSVQLDGILDFLSLGEGLVPEVESFDVRTLLDELGRCFDQECKLKGIEFRLVLDPSLPPLVSTDRRRLRLVLFGVIERAVKYSSWGEVSISAAVRKPSPEQDDRLLITVKDTSSADGSGDSFLALTSTEHVAPIAGNRWNPLALSGPLLTMLDGKAHVDDATGIGCQVSLSIPVVLDVLAASPLPEIQSGKRLLVVEDDLTNWVVLKALLLKAEYALDHARTGEEALKLAARRRYDAVLMDIQLPGMDGLETTRSIQGDPKGMNRATPIVAVTAFAMQGDKDMCLEAGMAGYVAKPVSMDKLQPILASVFAAGKGDSQD